MNEFTKLMIDTAQGAVQNYTTSDANTAIRNHIFEVMGIEPTSDMKAIRKAVRRHKVEIFEIIEETIDNMLISGWGDNPFFRELVEVKNLADGDTNEFYIPDNSILTVAKYSGGSHNLIRQKLGKGETKSITTNWYGIKIYEEFERYMAGRFDWAKFIEKLYEAVDRKVNDMIYSSFSGLDAVIPADMQFSGTVDAAAILNMVEKVEIATGHPAYIAAPRTALTKIINLTDNGRYSNEMKNERNTLGGLGMWEGVKLVRIPQAFEQNTRTMKYPAGKFYILPEVDVKPIKLVYEGESIYNENTDQAVNADMTITAEYMTKLGVGVVLGADFAVGTIS